MKNHLLAVILEQLMKSLLKKDKVMVKAKKLAWKDANSEMLDDVGVNALSI